MVTQEAGAAARHGLARSGSFWLLLDFEIDVNLLSLFFTQNIAHAEGAYKGSDRSQCPELLLWPVFR